MFWGIFPVSNVGLEDAQYYIWLLWHTSRGFLGQNQLLFTNLLFHPFGATLAFDTPFLNTLISLPFYLLWGPVASYNFLVFFSFAATFAGFYLFLNLITKNKIAAFLGGLLFTFSAYRMTMFSLGQIDLLSTEWLGFTLYYLFKYFDNAKSSGKFLTFFAVFFSLNAYTDYRTFVIATLAVLISIILLSLIKIKNTNFTFSKLMKFVILSSLLLLPLILVHFKNLSLYPTYAEPDSPWLTLADLLAYVNPLPSLTHFYFGLAIPFIGILQLILLFPYIFVFRKDNSEAKTAWFWVFFGISFLLLSLGDSLFINGNRIFSSDVMPYPILKSLPVFSFFRSPVRFSLGVSIATTVIATFSLSKILGKLKNSKYQLIVVIFLSLFAITQNIPFIPKIEIQKLNNSVVFKKLGELGSGTVLYIPFGYMDTFSELQGIYDTNLALSQIDHKKPVIGGYLSYVSKETLNDFSKDRFITKLISCEKTNICTPVEISESKAAIKKFSLKYILIDKKYLNGPLTLFLEKSFKIKLLTESSEFKLMEISE